MKPSTRILLTLGFLCSLAVARAQDTKPNIIFILADDLGYGDLSCYGQKKFSTPHIDKLAKTGMRFTNAYAGTAVCAPSRSALMTGLHTGHTPIRGNYAHPPEGQYPMPDSVTMISELLRANGYALGCFGKWGLGYPGSVGDPAKRGFTEFFGYNCQTLAHNYYPYHLWKNEEKIELPGNTGKGKAVYAPELIQQETLKFIEDHQAEPFMIFVTTVIPHAEVAAPDAYIQRFKGKFPPEIPFKGANPDSANYIKAGKYTSQATPHAGYAAMITYLDDQVGQIMDKLKSLGLDQNTLVIFTSDNGPSIEGGEDPNYFNSNGGLRGHKRDLYEGGIREPFIANWPGHIQQGAVNNQVIAFWDMLPTFAELTSTSLNFPVDGYSIVPALTGVGTQRQHEYFYWEFHEQGGAQAVRKGNWKAVRRNVAIDPASPLELYDLSTDPKESKNLAKVHPDIVKDMSRIMHDAHVANPVFNFKPVKE